MGYLDNTALSNVLTKLKTWINSNVANKSHNHTRSEITDFPTNVSSFTNDSGYLTSHQDISGKVNKSGDTIDGVLKVNGYTEINSPEGNTPLVLKGSQGTSYIGFMANTGLSNGFFGVTNEHKPVFHYNGDKEIITSDTIGSQSVNYASSADNANYVKYTYANEINFKGGRRSACYFNYRNADDGSTGTSQTVDYYFCDYAGHANGNLICGSINGSSPITSGNIGSQSVNYASSANYSNSAGNADTVDGYHSYSLMKLSGNVTPGDDSIIMRPDEDNCDIIGDVDYRYYQLYCTYIYASGVHANNFFGNATSVGYKTAFSGTTYSGGGIPLCYHNGHKRVILAVYIDEYACTVFYNSSWAYAKVWGDNNQVAGNTYVSGYYYYMDF